MKLINYIFIAFLLFANTVQATDGINLPDFGDSAGSTISPDFERRIGKAFMRSIRQHATIYDDPEIEGYIESIGYNLAANSDSNNLSFSFFVIDNPDINAFAAPGGIIGINSGVILNARSESELAGVLAHEIAHVTQRHMARQFERAGKFSIPGTAALLGALLIGIANPEAGAAALSVVTGVAAQTQINFTRANEEEADAVGMQLLARSGFDPNGMPAFFERLQQKSEAYTGNAPEFLRTHPLTNKRIADSKARVAQLPRIHHENTTSYELVRAKIVASSFKKPKDAITHFKSLLETAPDKEKNIARYGYAIALMRAGEFFLAREQMKALLAWDKDNIAYMLTAAKIDIEERNYPAAIKIYKEAFQLYPNYRPLVLAYGKALLDNGQAGKSRDLLLHYGRLQVPDPAYYDLLAQVEAANGSMAYSGIAKAEYFYLTGDTKLAVDRLLHAKRQGNLDYFQQEQIDARIAELQYELELEEKLNI